MPRPFYFHAGGNKVSRVDFYETDKRRCRAWYDMSSSEEASKLLGLQKE